MRTEENNGDPNRERCVDVGVSFVPAGKKLACSSSALLPLPHLREGKNKASYPSFSIFIFQFIRTLKVQCCDLERVAFLSSCAEQHF